MGLSSCSEDDISPSANNWLVDFPQGSNTYDTEIKQVYDLYGTQMLYRYNDGMMRWMVTEQLDYVSRPGDEHYVGEAVKFIKDNCFRYYQQDSLRKYLPTAMRTSASDWPQAASPR